MYPLLTRSPILKKEEENPLFFLTAGEICRMIILISVCRESAAGGGKLHAADTACRRAGAKKAFSVSSSNTFRNRSSGGNLHSNRLPAALADGACLPGLRNDAGFGGTTAVGFFRGATDASARLSAATCRRLAGVWAFGSPPAPKDRTTVDCCRCRSACHGLSDSAACWGFCGKTGLFKFRFT